nr:Pectate lyase [Ipomoea batatas]
MSELAGVSCPEIRVWSCVVVNWVGKVVGQVLQWALSGNDGLNEESEHGEHGKSAILDLLDLELSESLWVVSEAQWVEAATWVEWVGDLTEGSTGNTVTLNGSHQHNLASPDGQDALSVDQAWVAQVVKTSLAEDLSSGLEPHRLAELDAVAGQQLRENASKSSKHRPSAVDHLQLTVLGEGLWVSREASSVPSVVAGELSGLAAPFLMVNLAFPVISGVEGESFTAFPAKEGEERAIVAAAIALV